MKRRYLRSLLHTYYPTDCHEKVYKTMILEFIDTHIHCFERSLELGHITASSWLLNKHHTHALLTHHAKLNRWLQLGGHCDGNSDVLAVALKEAQEESGILNIEPIFDHIFDIDIHLIPETKKEKAHYHYDIRFLLHAIHDEEAIASKESHALRWIDETNTNILLESPTIARMFNKWKLWRAQQVLHSPSFIAKEKE